MHLQYINNHLFLVKTLVVVLLLLVASQLMGCTSSDLPNQQVSDMPPEAVSGDNGEMTEEPEESNIYYVDINSGSNMNPGTQSRPWKTIQKAARAMPAGSTVIVSEGNYQERVRIKDPNLTFVAQGDVFTEGFIIEADYVTVSGFIIISLVDDIDDGVGIYVPKAGYCRIENNRILYNTWGGLRLMGSVDEPDATHDCVVHDNIFIRNALFAAEIMGQNHLITNNEVSHSIQHHPCSNSTAEWLDADAFRFHGSGHIFRGNYIHDMLYGPSGFDTTACNLENLADLSKDFVSDSHTDCFQTYDGSRIAGHDILFEGNRCELPPADQWTDGYGAKAFQGTGNTYNLTFQNNLVVADFLSLFEDGCRNISFLHNTFIGSSSNESQGLKFIGCYGGNTVKNNVFYQQQNGVGHILIQNSPVDAGNNCVFREGGRPSRPADPGDLWNIHPRLDSNYQLQPSSPCIDAGLDLGVMTDFNEEQRPQGSGFDIGAFEYQP